LDQSELSKISVVVNVRSSLLITNLRITTDEFFGSLPDFVIRRDVIQLSSHSATDVSMYGTRTGVQYTLKSYAEKNKDKTRTFTQHSTTSMHIATATLERQHTQQLTSCLYA
jgi:hypothetical protein